MLSGLEQLDSYGANVSGAVALDETSHEFLAAFLKASKSYLDREEFDLLREQSWGLLRKVGKS